ncbi:beta-phosphoglucomutase-like phosphatase (HAD superfamily) [Brevibacillus nitrificans]|nr:beta-phosphoglucomutase-like phosphatase (HAD superfamily) [Brevibacillus nitrificans]
MRTLLFDFDGTVADTLPLIFTAFRSTFERFLQKHYTDDQIIALFGPKCWICFAMPAFSLEL